MQPRFILLFLNLYYIVYALFLKVNGPLNVWSTWINSGSSFFQHTCRKISLGKWHSIFFIRSLPSNCDCTSSCNRAKFKANSLISHTLKRARTFSSFLKLLECKYNELQLGSIRSIEVSKQKLHQYNKTYSKGRKEVSMQWPLARKASRISKTRQEEWWLQCGAISPQNNRSIGTCIIVIGLSIVNTGS